MASLDIAAIQARVKQQDHCDWLYAANDQQRWERDQRHNDIDALIAEVTALHATIARLTAERDAARADLVAWRMELHRWMQSPTPCPPYLPALAPALEKLDETIDSLKTAADIRWRDLEAALATIERAREACDPKRPRYHLDGGCDIRRGASSLCTCSPVAVCAEILALLGEP